MAAGDNTYLESDGKSVTVQLVKGGVDKGDVAYIQGWLGISDNDGASEAYVSLTIDRREYQFTVPSGLTVNRGDTVYIDTAHSSLTSSHIPGDAAYSTSAGAGKVALFKATTTKDGNNVVNGILLAGLFAS